MPHRENNLVQRNLAGTVGFSLAGSNEFIGELPRSQSVQAGGHTLQITYAPGAFRIVGGPVPNYVDSGLNKKNTYSYRVRAFNDNGSSAYSNTASGKPK